MIPEKSQGKVLQATVVAIGSGSKGKVNRCIISIQFFTSFWTHGVQIS